LPAQIKFLDVDKEGNRLVASHKKAVVDSSIVDLTIGSVVKGALPHRGQGRAREGCVCVLWWWWGVGGGGGALVWGS